MAVVAIRMKALPESPEADLESLKKEISSSLMNSGAIKINAIEEEPLAFGLKAIIVTIAWPEAKETSDAEKACQVSGISSVEIIDYRRAFG
ncbi:elongation factor 1-beta [Candidatus Pacearchaeota archaeon]|nr:elongation factor 1-beta [Candidatus Pacearchaeota archaeon]